MLHDRALVLHAKAGLGNRITSLLSAMAVCRESGRALRLVWEPDPIVGLPFGDLFAAPVLVGTRPRDDAMPYFDMLSHEAPVLSLVEDYWNYREGRCQADLWRQFRPVPGIQRRIDAEADRLPALVVGVHVRRKIGDWERHMARYHFCSLPTFRQYFEAIDAHPGHGVFLATDDPDVQRVFRKRYGARLSLPEPRRRQRRVWSVQEEAREALIDLYLLQRCPQMVMSYGSSFSEVASIGVQRANIRGPMLIRPYLGDPDMDTPDLAAYLLEAHRLHEDGQHQACQDLLNRYLRLRQTLPEPRVTILGQEWPGDHVLNTYNRACLLALKGPAAFPD